MSEIKKGYIRVPCPSLKCDGEAKVLAKKVEKDGEGKFVTDMYFGLGLTICPKCRISFTPFPFASPLYDMTIVTVPPSESKI